MIVTYLRECGAGDCDLPEGVWACDCDLPERVWAGDCDLPGLVWECGAG